MARPRKQTYTMQQYLENVKEGYISNDADTQRNPEWKPIVDGLAVTILTDDYIPAIILAEEESGQIHIVDGGSRTASFMMIRYGNYKIKASLENTVIPYKKINKDENGKTFWEEAEFDIKGKTYDQFPKELQKKFNEYQLDTVVHECDKEGIAKYLKRYNIHKEMNTNQKMFVHLPNFAKQIRETIKRDFFINSCVITDNEKEKGALERVILEAAMCTFHLDKWSGTWKNNPIFLNSNATDEEFEKIDENIKRLGAIISDDTKVLFNGKDAFIWISLFDKFTKTGFPDKYFEQFLKSYLSGLKNKKVEGKTFDTAEEKDNGVRTTTKGKYVVSLKLHILETLMNEYLNTEKEEEITSERFIAEVVGIPMEAVEEDMECYEQTLDELEDNTIKIGSKLLNPENRNSLLAMVAYSYKNDIDLDNWLSDYAVSNNTYIVNQKRNFNIMVEDLHNYIDKNKEKGQEEDVCKKTA